MLGPKFSHFCFRSKNLQISKFGGADFKYDKYCFQISAQKYPDKAFLVPYLGIFIFSRNFSIRQS